MPGFKEIDSPVQMRLYTLTKQRFVMVFIGFCVSFFLILMIGILGPNAIGENTATAKELGVVSKNFQTGPFLIHSGMVNKFNQEMWLFTEFKLDNLPLKEDYTLERKFNIMVKLMGISKDSSYQLINHSYRNRTRLLKCNTKSCESIAVFHLGTLAYPSYLVNVTFYGLHLPAGVTVRNVYFTFKYYEAQFTQIQIWFRFVFLVLTFTVTCLFTRGLHKFSFREWCIEQRWMSILLPLLLLYNDPLFPLTFLTKAYFPHMLDAFFQGTFFAGLLLFWLCAYHGIRECNRKCMAFYLPKLIIVGAIWITGTVILVWQQINEISDPTYKVDINHFLILKIFFFVLAACYLIYLIILIIQAFQELKNMPYFDVRLKFLTSLMLLVVLISLVAVFLRFGLAAIQDSIAINIATTYKNSAEFLAFYGLFNVYLYTMAYMYSPSPRALQNHGNLKAAPSSFSIVADSDDEVLTFDRGDFNRKISKINEDSEVDEDETLKLIH